MKYAFIVAAAFILAACGEKPESAGSAAATAPAAAPSAAEAPASPEERGRKLFNECAVCHTAKQGEGNRVGPNLFGIVGSPAGAVEGFAYSKAMKESGVVWTDETLDGFLENPVMYLKGSRMAYAGQRDAQKRADIIAYLKTLK